MIFMEWELCKKEEGVYNATDQALFLQYSSINEEYSSINDTSDNSNVFG